MAKVNEGDWICSNKSCENVNFSFRDKCNKCGHDKGKVDFFKKMGAEIGKSAAKKSGGLFSAEDWQCTMCGNVNWARRSECNVCKHPKFSKVEARTGFGGGYCDREDVEYKEREESDDEFDDFGRRKKKFRKSSENGSKTQEPPRDNDDEDDSDVDLSKYELAESDNEGVEPVSSTTGGDGMGGVGKEKGGALVGKTLHSTSSEENVTSSRRKRSYSTSSERSSDSHSSYRKRGRSYSRSSSRDRRSRRERSRERKRSRGRDRSRSRDRQSKRRSRSRSRGHSKRSRSRSRGRRRSRSRDHYSSSRRRRSSYSRSRSRDRSRSHNRRR